MPHPHRTSVYYRFISISVCLVFYHNAVDLIYVRYQDPRGLPQRPDRLPCPRVVNGHDRPRPISPIDEADCWRLGGTTSVCAMRSVLPWTFVLLFTRLFMYIRT